MRIFLVLFFSPLYIFCQDVKYISGRVTDGDNQPLEYANVLIVDSENGAYSDQDGIFELSISSEDSSVVVSYIGYISDTIDLSLDIDDTYQVQLEPLSVDLLPVTITSSSNTQKGDLGYYDDPEQYYFYPNKHGYILAVLIENTLNRDCYISRIKTRFGKPQNAPVIRYRFFEPDVSEGIIKPGKEVHYNLPTYTLKRKNFKIDVQFANIVVPVEGLFIGVEMISGGETEDTKIHPGFRHTALKDTFRTWGSFMTGKWILTQMRDRDTGRPLNMMIAADVRY